MLHLHVSVLVLVRIVEVEIPSDWSIVKRRGRRLSTFILRPYAPFAPLPCLTFLDSSAKTASPTSSGTHWRHPPSPSQRRSVSNSNSTDPGHTASGSGSSTGITSPKNWGGSSSSNGLGLTLGASPIEELEQEGEGDAAELEEEGDVDEESRLYSMRMGGLNGNGKGGDMTPKRIKPKGNLRSRWLAVLSLRAYPLLLVVLSVVLLSRALSRPRQHSAYQLSVDLSNAAFSEGIGGGRGSIPLQLKPWRHLTKPLAQILRPKRPLSPPPPPPSASEDRILHSSYAGTDQDDLDHPPKHFVPLTKEELVALVGRDPKFLIRDNHATYGYNNVRYIFENTLLWGKVMKRIPVIPDAVWGRTCAVERCVQFRPFFFRRRELIWILFGSSEVCNQFAMEHYTNRTEAAERIGITSNFWNEDGEVWK